MYNVPLEIIKLVLRKITFYWKIVLSLLISAKFSMCVHTHTHVGTWENYLPCSRLYKCVSLMFVKRIFAFLGVPKINSFLFELFILNVFCSYGMECNPMVMCAKIVVTTNIVTLKQTTETIMHSMRPNMQHMWQVEPLHKSLLIKS